MRDRDALHPPHVRRAAAAVAEILGVEAAAILGSSRPAPVALGRHVLVYALRTGLGHSYPTIAGEIGYADHTSVMHAVDRIAKRNDTRTLHLVAVAKRALGVVPALARIDIGDDWWAEQRKAEEATRAG